MTEKAKVSDVQPQPEPSPQGGGVTGTGTVVASANNVRVYVNGIPQTGTIYLRQVGDGGWSIEKVDLKSVFEVGGE
jgi:hypothetical protein